MRDLEQIYEFSKAFAAYLQSINVSAMKDAYTKEKLCHFQKAFAALPMRNLSRDLALLISQMKDGAHSSAASFYAFPILQKIDFLSEETKKALDNHLSRFSKGQYFSSIGRVISDSGLQKQTLTFLKKAGILEDRFIVICPRCCKSRLSAFMTLSEKEELECLFSHPEKKEILEMHIRDLCHLCQFQFPYGTIQIEEIPFQVLTKVIGVPAPGLCKE